MLNGTRKKMDKKSIYLLFLSVLAVWTLIRNFLYHGAPLNSIMYYEKTGYFTDFFEVLATSSDRSAYLNMNLQYPPLSILIMKALLTFIPLDMTGTKDSIFGLRATQEGLMLFVLCFMFCIFIMFAMICKNLKIGKRELVSFFLFFSTPMIFLVNRGNTLVFAAIFVMVFLFGYNSQKAYIRELSYIALAIAFNIKVVPCILGFLLLKDKKYKEAVRCAVYAIVILLVTFLFFDSTIDSMKNFFGSLFLWGGAMSGDLVKSTDIATTLRRLFIVASGTEDVLYMYALCKRIAKVIIVGSFVSAFLSKKRYISIAVWATVMVAFSEMSFAYNYVYLLAPFVIFLNEATFDNIGDYVMAAGYTLIWGSFTSNTEMIELMFNADAQNYLYTQLPIALLGIGALMILLYGICDAFKSSVGYVKGQHKRIARNSRLGSEVIDY